jgi:hypothetical protein
LYGFTPNLAAAELGLLVGDRQERVVVDRLNKSIAQCIVHRT